MKTRTVELVAAPSHYHWVGDGFRVHNYIPGGYHLEMERMDPFILMDYNSKYTFPPSDKPRGVGVHPHRGFETVTIAYKGKVQHHDSSGGGRRLSRRRAEAAVHGHGLRSVLAQVNGPQTVRSREWIGRIAMCRGRTADPLRVPLDDALEQAHPAGVRNERLDARISRHGPTPRAVASMPAPARNCRRHRWPPSRRSRAARARTRSRAARTRTTSTASRR